MKGFKNFVIGFFISFVGSLPFGHLNIAGFSILQAVGYAGVTAYLAGVLIPEALVIYCSSVFATRIAENHTLEQGLSLISMMFLATLSVVFFLGGNSDPATNPIVSLLSRNPFITGLTLSSLNFIQIPFWVGWNIYLASSGAVRFTNPLLFIYLIGTLTGTFCGMAAFIYSMDLVTGNGLFNVNFFLGTLVPAIFLILAIFQGFMFFKKHRRKS